MIRARRGRSREATNSSMVAAGTKLPVSPNSATKASVFAGVRLYTATVWPWLAKFRAMLEPITARPTTPI